MDIAVPVTKKSMFLCDPKTPQEDCREDSCASARNLASWSLRKPENFR
jgi:hypothetical protein